jgi:ribosomal protein S18 acetylase RimI-like enzyme
VTTTFDYRTLEGVAIDELHECFVEAFSDYQVKMDLPIEHLETMLRRRGFVSTASVGAYDGDRLVGLLLNGVREWRGARTAYDTGTGVVPEHRRRGATTGMFREAVRLLRAAGVRQYLLEVIRTNEPAVALYRREGFATTRTFTCYASKREALAILEDKGAVDVRPVLMADIDWRLVREWWDLEPSWQNSVDSVTAVADSMAAVGAFEGGEMVGYGIVEPATGDVPQLAVRPDRRRSGAGSAILHGLLGSTASPRLAVINVEDGPTAAHAFLKDMGFEPFVGQYEMVLTI